MSSSSPHRPRIPVVVLAGFLGSGKTTLLNHLLLHRAGNRIGVIVNDFEAIEIDAIVIEASGLAEPQELVRVIPAGDNPHIVYGGLVEVVDAAEFEATRERHPEIGRHLAVADLVVLNKTDRAGDEEWARVRKAVAETGSTAAVIPATYGRIDPELLFDTCNSPATTTRRGVPPPGRTA